MHSIALASSLAVTSAGAFLYCTYEYGLALYAMQHSGPPISTHDQLWAALLHRSTPYAMDAQPSYPSYVQTSWIRRILYVPYGMVSSLLDVIRRLIVKSFSFIGNFAFTRVAMRNFSPYYSIEASTYVRIIGKASPVDTYRIKNVPRLIGSPSQSKYQVVRYLICREATKDTQESDEPLVEEQMKSIVDETFVDSGVTESKLFEKMPKSADIASSSLYDCVPWNCSLSDGTLVAVDLPDLPSRNVLLDLMTSDCCPKYAFLKPESMVVIVGELCLVRRTADSSPSFVIRRPQALFSILQPLIITCSQNTESFLKQLSWNWDKWMLFSMSSGAGALSLLLKWWFVDDR